MSAQESHELFPVVRIWADDAGVTHFEDGFIPLERSGPIGSLSAPVSDARVLFRSTGADYDYDWHPTPTRQFILMLTGEIEIQTGDGEIRRFGAGETLFLEDTAPPGHRTRNVGETPRLSVFVQADTWVPYQPR